MEEANWQFAPDFYKYVVRALDKVLDYKLMDDYEGAYTCLLDVFFGISELISKKDDKLFKEIESEIKTYEEANDALYHFSISKAGEISKINNMATQSRKMKIALNNFHHKLMRGAQIAGILIPVKEKSETSGAKKFSDKYIKTEVEDGNVDY